MILKSVFLIAIVAVAMIGVMVPSVFAQQSETTITLESFKSSISLLYETRILLSGQLLNENGNSLSGKEVWVHGNIVNDRGQSKSAFTDSNGRFTIDYDNLSVNSIGTWTIYAEFEGDSEYMQSSSEPRQLKMTLPVPGDTNKLDWSLIFVTSKKECSFEDEESMKFSASLTDDYLKQYNLPSNPQMVRCISHDVMSDVINIFAKQVDLFIVIPDYDLSVVDRHTTGWGGHYSNWEINTIVSQHLSQSVEDRDSAWTLSHELAHFAVDWNGYSWDIVGNSVHTIQGSYNDCKNKDTTLTHCQHLYDTVRTPSGSNFPVMDANYVIQIAESMVVPKYTPPPTPKYTPPPKSAQEVCEELDDTKWDANKQLCLVILSTEKPAPKYTPPQDTNCSSISAGAMLKECVLGKMSLKYSDLRGADLSGVKLSGKNLEGANLEGADLEGADLSGANFYGANLEGADLSGAKLTRLLSYFEGIVDGYTKTSMINANLRDADLSGADLSGASLEDADLKGANLKGAILEDADLKGANLSYANLSGADLTNPARTLEGANLSGADLSGTNLKGVNLSGADLSGADLSGANLNEANLYRADLSGADLSGADISRTNLSYADLSQANLSGADISRTDLSGADLSGADLNDANLEDGWLDYSNLSQANLSGADLSRTDLSGANLDGAILRNTNLDGADLSGADLTNTQLEAAIEIQQEQEKKLSETTVICGAGTELINGVCMISHKLVNCDDKLAKFHDSRDLSGIVLANCNLENYEFIEYDLRGADLSRANLEGVDLFGADLSGADLRYANLSGADLSSVMLVEADLRYANLSGANLQYAQYAGANFYGADKSNTQLDANFSTEQLEVQQKLWQARMTQSESEQQQEKIAQLEAEQNGGGCLIATATYGSELAPQVQQLRELRDNQLLQTESGTAFMETFNDIYYSFSPTIADMEREHPMFKEAVKLAITPMISSLSLMENANSESEVLSIGISVIMLNLGMYLGVPAIVIIGIKKKF